MIRSALIAVCCAAAALSQAPRDPFAGLPPDPSANIKSLKVRSPEVHPDRTVTFRLLAPGAHSVELMQGTRENWLGPPRPMSPDANGVWSIEVGPLPPNIYYYAFALNGVRYIEQGSISTVEVRDATASFDDARDVPHGVVRIHWYRSNSLGKLQRLYVYTPPLYRDDAAGRYPVLYLLHGMGLNESAWTSEGHANFILDNLIAEEKAVPMVVVMPFGQPLSHVSGISEENTRAYEQDLVEDVIPFVQAHYRVSSDRLDRAIAGMSMGGLQALKIGLDRLDLFAWVGGFSSAVHQTDPKKEFAAVLRNGKDTNERLRLLWIGCGSSDHLFTATEKLGKVLAEHGIRHAHHVSEGGHTWQVWRRNLYYDFAPLLFQPRPRP
jgi:enterochelin esterase family protein